MHSVHFGSVRVLALTCCEERGLGVYACQADQSVVVLVCCEDCMMSVYACQADH